MSLNEFFLTAGHSVPTPFGYSLFTSIPKKRTCQNASIDLEFCACGEDEEANDLSAVEIAAMSQAVIDKVNFLLKPKLDLCHKLTLDRNIKIRYRYLIKEDKEGKITKKKVVFLQVSALPSGALFEALLTSTKPYSVIGAIGRLDKYYGQYECISHILLERYCFCRNLKVSENKEQPLVKHSKSNKRFHENCWLLGGLVLMTIGVLAVLLNQTRKPVLEYRRLSNVK